MADAKYMEIILLSRIQNRMRIIVHVLKAKTALLETDVEFQGGMMMIIMLLNIIHIVVEYIKYGAWSRI